MDEYLVLIKLTNEMDPALDTSGDRQILVSGEHRNTVYLDQVNLSYTVIPPSITLENESLSRIIISPPGSVKNAGQNIFGPKAAEKLRSSLAVGEEARVRVTIVFTGKIISGGLISSTPVSYPITAYNGGFAGCPAGETLCKNGPCGRTGGQDVFPVTCSMATVCPAATK